MPIWLYDTGPGGLWVFLFATVLLGGVAAFISGRAIAQTWRPLAMLPFYMLMLAATVRFIHYALFDETLLSIRNFLFDFIVLCAISVTGYRLMRSRQMVEQYGWRSGPGGA
jgi:hypothetical protein